MAADPAGARLLRRQVLLLIGGIEMRHGHFFEAPYNFAALVDPVRVPAARRAAVVRQFSEEQKPCCVRPGLARAIRSDLDRSDSGLDIASP
eukprot:5451035-Pyramimonas_sp.AAC.1